MTLDDEIARKREQVIAELMERILAVIRTGDGIEDVAGRIYGSPRQDDTTYALLERALQRLVSAGKLQRQRVTGLSGYYRLVAEVRDV